MHCVWLLLRTRFSDEVVYLIYDVQEMSYNNYLDADAAWNCVCEFNNPTCVVVKHTNPCGVASVGPNQGLLEAYRLAVRADPVSAFGGIVAFNVEVDEVKTGSFGFRNFHVLFSSYIFSLLTECHMCFYRLLHGRFESSGVLQMVKPGCFMRSL